MIGAFKQGETYIYAGNSSKVYTCVYADDNTAVVKQAHKASRAYNNYGADLLSWEVYTPSLQFKELEIGEKFFWKKPRVGGNHRAMKIKYPCPSEDKPHRMKWVYLEGHLMGTCYNNDDDNPAPGHSDVERS